MATGDQQEERRTVRFGRRELPVGFRQAGTPEYSIGTHCSVSLCCQPFSMLNPPWVRTPGCLSATASIANRCEWKLQTQSGQQCSCRPLPYTRAFPWAPPQLRLLAHSGGRDDAQCAAVPRDHHLQAEEVGNDKVPNPFRKESNCGRPKIQPTAFSPCAARLNHSFHSFGSVLTFRSLLTLCAELRVAPLLKLFCQVSFGSGTLRSPSGKAALASAWAWLAWLIGESIRSL